MAESHSWYQCLQLDSQVALNGFHNNKQHKYRRVMKVSVLIIFVVSIILITVLKQYQIVSDFNLFPRFRDFTTTYASYSDTKMRQ